ncbi:MAG: redoxin domain-containing protein [Planctomycetia bacterium]|nr:redoxin domain-containing protein [Planctomycetia bacterium]
MRRISLRSLALVLGLAATALLLPGWQRAADAPVAKTGHKIDDFALKDAAGKDVSLYGLKDRKAVVVVFLSFDCPNSTNYSPTLIQLHQDYAARGVAFLGICPCDDDAAQVAKHAAEYKLPFPVLRDDKFRAVEALKAEVTPEAFLLDGEYRLRYRGRIDNGFAGRLKKNLQITHHDLKKALDEVLAGKEVSEPVTQAVGCSIIRESTAKATDGKVTYHRDVLPILQNHCQSCHRPGEVGPFSLMTYKQAVNWAADIKDFTHSKRMPPWKPADGLSFRDERKLTEQQIATLAAWVAAGTPEGNAADAPPAKQFTKGWQLGEPDLVLSVDADFTLGASGRDLFRCFVLPTNLTEDKYVTALEVRPGNPRVVHHTLNFIDTAGRGRKLEETEKARAKKEGEPDSGPGYSMSMGVGFAPNGALGGWAPGQMARHLPDGSGYLLPKGSDVVVQVHYHRNGRVEKDRVQIGLYFAKQPVTHRFQAVVLPGRFLLMPAGVEDFKVTGNVTIDQDCDLHSVMPHMHLLGKTIKVTMTPPDGKAETVIDIKEWDYNWQETYFFKEPLKIKAGTKFNVEARYDNSAKNPNNPNNPPKLVHFGEQTTDEMCFIFFGATSDKPGRIRMKFGF